MSEPIETNDELSTLRRTNAELVKKASDRKRRIAELVASTTELQAKLSASQTALYDATVGVPLREMAEAVSPVPEIWLSEFGRHFKVEMQDGKLAILSSDGKPAMLGGSQVEFTREHVTSLLTKSDNPAFKAFKTIMISSRASGGGIGSESGQPFGSDAKPKSEQATPPLQFGLR